MFSIIISVIITIAIVALFMWLVSKCNKACPEFATKPPKKPYVRGETPYQRGSSYTNQLTYLGRGRCYPKPMRYPHLKHRKHRDADYALS